MKKAMWICWMIAILSLIACLIIILVIGNISSENWNETISSTLRISSKILWGCVVSSYTAGLLLKLKINEQKTKDKIKELESEIEQLKKK